MLEQQLKIALVFKSDDQAWIRRTAVEVPQFWRNHAVAPALGDVLRLGGRQFIIQARVWEHDNDQPVLRLFLSSGQAHSDTSFSTD
jgi:hypothetical protein